MRLLAICALALAFGYIGSMPLAGPVAIMALSRAARKRFGEALRVGLGAAIAEGLYAGVAFFGYTSLLGRRPEVVPISRGATALILGALGLHFAFWRRKEAKDRRENKAGTALLGFSVSAANPTLFLTWSTAVALLYSKGLEQPPALYAIPFGVSAACGVGGWFFSLTLLLRRYGARLSEAAFTWTVRAMGVLLVVLGAWSGVDLVRWLDHRR
ncbi:MAG: LysE family translocator [Polyangiaceae bacterium]